MQRPVEYINSLIDELEDMIYNSKQALSMGGPARKVVDQEAMFSILDELKANFPREFADAERVLKEEEEILDRAQQQADAIISDAKQQAMILAGDQEVVRLAQQQADAVRDAAEQYERDTRYNAEQYAETVLAHLEDHMKTLTNSIGRLRQTIDENSGPRNTTNNVSW